MGRARARPDRAGPACSSSRSSAPRRWAPSPGSRSCAGGSVRSRSAVARPPETERPLDAPERGPPRLPATSRRTGDERDEYPSHVDPETRRLVRAGTTTTREWTREPPDRTGAARAADVSRLRRRAPAIQGSADRSSRTTRTTRRSGRVRHRRMRVAPRKARPFVPGRRSFSDSRGTTAMTTADPLSLTQAQRLAANADTILLRATRPADLETPIGAFLRLDDGGPAYLLESVEGGERLGRYSFLGVGPRRLLEVRDGVARIQTRPVDRARLLRRTCRSRRSTAPIRWPRSARSSPRRRVQPTEGMPRFTGGAVGALAYDAVSTFEPTVPLPDRDPVGVPTAAFIETDLVLVFDHLTHTLSAIASLHTEAPDFEGALPDRRGGDLRGARADGAAERRRDRRSAAQRPTGTRRRAAVPAPVDPIETSLGPRRVHPRRRGRQGRDRGRRGDPGRPRPAPVVRPADGPATGRAARRHRPVPRPPPGQPEPVPVLRPDAGVRGRRRIARAAAPGRGRPADDPPDRRHAPAWRRRPRGRAPGRAAPARPEGARRARDARRPRAQRPRAGRAPGHGDRSASTWRSSATATSSISCRTSRGGCDRSSTRSTRCARSSRPARCRARRRSARCSSSRPPRASGAACTAARSATSATTATSTRRSRSGARS